MSTLACQVTLHGSAARAVEIIAARSAVPPDVVAAELVVLALDVLASTRPDAPESQFDFEIRRLVRRTFERRDAVQQEAL
ncbi:MAG: hypothetical protein HY791_36315 [Deltaproteobacteria bacterium]|nr:hypothetical protein [Deltaproteobacteria bacterium]